MDGGNKATETKIKKDTSNLMNKNGDVAKPNAKKSKLWPYFDIYEHNIHNF